MNDKQAVGLSKKRGLWIAVAAILVAGSLGTWWTARRADCEMREDLLQQAQMVAQTMNAERIKALSGTEADLPSPVYQRLKDQLIAVRQMNEKCRFISLVGRKANGEIFFFLDSESADSKDCSPAGQIYTEAPEGYERL